MYGNDIDINKLKTIPVSDTIIARRIDEMASDVRVQLIEKLRLADSFALQLDESTDVSKDAQLLAFVRFVDKEMQEEFLFLDELGDSAVLSPPETRAILVLEGQFGHYFSEADSWRRDKTWILFIPFTDNAADGTRLTVTEEDQLIELSTDSTFRH
ncbi:hypothetical protein KUCAC02_009769, partial [Chaenocephalus aceratus]